MSTSQTLILPTQRQEYFSDYDGEIATSKRFDDKKQLVLDWADQLASGETISSVAYVDSGVTRSSTSNTTTTTTTTVTGIGETEVTVTTSTSRILQKLVRFYSSETARARHGSDYA